jgi:hypothetical protein
LKVANPFNLTLAHAMRHDALRAGLAKTRQHVPEKLAGARNS